MDVPEPRAPLSALQARPKRPSRATRGPGRSPPQGEGNLPAESGGPRAFGWGAGPEEWMHPNPKPPTEPARLDRGHPRVPPGGRGATQS